MKNIETRKTIALGLAAAYVVFTGYALVTGRVVPVEFVATVGPVIGYYFGKSTAQDPKAVE